MQTSLSDFSIRNIHFDDLEDVHTLASHQSLDGTRRFIKAAIDENNRHLRYNYHLIIISSEKIILGSCGLYLKGNKTAEIGFILRRAFWGRGLGTMVAKSLMDFALQDLGQLRIIATCEVSNHACQAVLTKIGLKQTEITGGFAHYEFVKITVS